MNAVVDQRKPVKPFEVVKGLIELPKTTEAIKAALPAHISVERFKRIALTALAQNPKIAECDKNSIIMSLLSCAQLGLVTDPALGEAYLVPYKGKCTLVPGYRGLLSLARRSGDIGLIEAECFYENDDLTYVLGDNSLFEVKVQWHHDRGKMAGVYALAKDKHGALLARVVLPFAEVERIRKRSQVPDGPAWRDDYVEMAKKTGLRRLAKLLPLSPDILKGFRLSELNEEEGRPSYIDEKSGELIEGEPATESAAESTEGTDNRRRRRTSMSQLQDQIPPAAPTPPGRGVDPETGEVVS